MTLLLFLLALPIFLLFLLQKKKHNRHFCLPPGPRALPIIGNLHQLSDNSPNGLWKLSKQYGPLMFLKVGYLPILVVSSAEMAKETLKNHDLDICSRPDKASFRTLSYNGLDVAFGPYSTCWREMRKICVAHVFSSHRVQRTRPIRENKLARLIGKISKSATAFEPFNLSKELISLTFTIMCRVAFGKRYEEEEIETGRFRCLLQETEEVLASFFFSDCFPVFGGCLDRLTGTTSRLKRLFKDLDDFSQEIIDEHLDPNRQKTEEEDIIDVLLRLRREGSLAIDLTFDSIKAVLMNFFVGGTSTSAASVVWAMTHLMKNPEVMKKAQEEIRNNFGTNKNFVNEDEIRQLVYFNAVVQETLRLQPVVPLVSRETIKNFEIDGYEIPSKTMVLVNVWAIGRDPVSWENPEEFRPERFIGSSVDVKGRDFELIPFGAGRRICPGMFMGMATVELVLANLLHKFDWELPFGMKSENLDFDSLPGLTMHKKEHLCLLPRIYYTEARKLLQI